MKKKIGLCIAEKPTVAKSVAEFLSKGRFNKYQSASKYNPIFEFDYLINNQPYMLRVTSVLGHIMSYKFPDECKNWTTTSFEVLYQIGLEKVVLDQNEKVVKNIQQSAKDADELILWLDCDREGEAIAFDVIDACTKVNRRLRVQRAHFSALTKEDIERAVQNLTAPNQHLSDAVRVRQEIDLRIGASFTRFQTLNFRDILLGNQAPGAGVLSYGPCQFPTLGFIVERYKVIRDFVPEKFWSLSMKYVTQINGKQEEAKFEWNRYRLFDKLATVILFEKCQEEGKARITDVIKSKKTRTRPQPLNTIEAQKLISRKLKIASAQAMDIMEKLYQRGILSYPRTETNTFNPTINLRRIVNELCKNDVFGEFAQKVESGAMWGGPKNGKQDDKAHPPIHPVKHAGRQELVGDEWRVYELIARHFLACISKDAIGAETKIEVTLGGEHFTAKGLIIEEYNWLEVFHYEKWSDSTLPPLQKGQEFPPNLALTDGETKAPPLLTESDLIGKMDSNGIGTDATIHEHIKTIQERQYAVKQQQSFLPTQVGVNLIEAYEHLGIELYKPYLRAQMENDMKQIAQGNKSKDAVLRDCIAEMKRIFVKVHNSAEQMKHFLFARMQKGQANPYNVYMRNQQPGAQIGSGSGGDFPGGGSGGSGGVIIEESKNQQHQHQHQQQQQFSQPTGNSEFAQCPQCKKSNLKVKTSKAGSLFIACMGFPECKTTMSLPRALESITMTEETCKTCMSRDKKKVYKFRLDFVTDFVNEAMMEILPDDDNTSGVFCVMTGCDMNFKTLLDVTFGFQNKRTYENAYQANPTGVPNYYHQKPQNIPATTTNQAQKRRKMNDGQPQFVPDSGYGESGKKKNKENNNKDSNGGCQICGKKRHMKNSECPLYKNKKQ